MFGYKRIKIAKELAGSQPRVQFLPVLVGKVKEPGLAPCKRRSGESANMANTKQCWSLASTNLPHLFPTITQVSTGKTFSLNGIHSKELQSDLLERGKKILELLVLFVFICLKICELP